MANNIMEDLIGFRQGKLSNDPLKKELEEWQTKHTIRNGDPEVDKLFVGSEQYQQVQEELHAHPETLKNFVIYRADSVPQYTGNWSGALTVFAANADDDDPKKPNKVLAEALAINKTQHAFDPDFADSQGNTLLIKAAWNGLSANVGALMDAGANPNKTSYWGKTALMQMLEAQGNENISVDSIKATIGALVKYTGGANDIDLNVKNLDDQTAMDIAESLMSNEFDSKGRAHQVYNALKAAAEQFDKDKAKGNTGKPKENHEADIRNRTNGLFGGENTYRNILDDFKAHPEDIAALAYPVTDPNDPSKTQTNWLVTFAATSKTPQTANPVLQVALAINQKTHALDVNAADSQGFTPVAKAAWAGNSANVDALHKAGADLNKASTTPSQETPLTLVVTKIKDIDIANKTFDSLLTYTGSAGDITKETLQSALDAAKAQVDVERKSNGKVDPNGINSKILNSLTQRGKTYIAVLEARKHAVGKPAAAAHAEGAIDPHTALTLLQAHGPAASVAVAPASRPGDTPATTAPEKGAPVKRSGIA